MGQAICDTCLGWAGLLVPVVQVVHSAQASALSLTCDVGSAPTGTFCKRGCALHNSNNKALKLSAGLRGVRSYSQGCAASTGLSPELVTEAEPRQDTFATVPTIFKRFADLRAQSSAAPTNCSSLPAGTRSAQSARRPTPSCPNNHS